MIAAYYGRVSTQRQEEEETIESQFLAIRDFARDNGHTLVKEYKDEGWSGTILARPSLDELRIDAKNKIWEALIVYDPDRLARKYSYQSLVIDELEEIGIKVLFVTTPPAKTDEDKLLYGVKGIFAEYERARITDRFRLGKLRKARAGNIVTTEAPYGYIYIPKQGKTEGYYQINPQEVSVVKMIFSWVGEQGFTIRDVVRKLQELNIKPRKSKRGVWNTSTLVTLLRNETYVGKAHYLKSYATVPENPLKNDKYRKVKKTSRKFRPQEEWIEIATPQIIEQELFDKTRRQLKENFELSNRNRKNEYLLSGRIYCVCGQRRAGEGAQRGKHLYYRCTDRVHSFPLPPQCTEGGINARIADLLVWKEMSKLMVSPGLIKQQAERWVSKKGQKSNAASGSLEKLEVELEKIKKEEQKYIKAYGADVITFEQLQEAVGGLKTKRASLEGQIKDISEKKEVSFETPTALDIERLTEKSSQMLKELNDKKLGFEMKQGIVRKLVDKIVANQTEIIVSGYLPLRKEEEEYVGFWSISRNSWSSKHWKIYVI